MPPSLVDQQALVAIAESLREIADTVAGFGHRAAGGGEERHHVAPLEQIQRSLAEISEELKGGLASPGDHSAQYAQIEKSLGAISNAVKGLSSRS